MNGVRHLVSTALGAMPEKIQIRVNPRKYGFTPADIPPPPAPPQSPVRVYLAPVNFSAQGFYWARALEMLPGVGAVSMQYCLDDYFGFPSDDAVPVKVFVKSRDWQRRQFRAVTEGFTHVLIEAERSLFGALFDNDVRREVAALREAGLTVGMISHGSDLRSPSLHREVDQWSPFDEAEWDLVPVLEEQAQRNQKLLRDLGAPVFVTTPEMLLDWPEAQWLPNVVDPLRWQGKEDALLRDVPVVVHAPSNPIIKGTRLIEPVARAFADRGRIDYRVMQGVPSTAMPSVLGSADIVLEQFRLGSYGTTALEAMAAGRVVVGHVRTQVRDHIQTSYGRPVPIVEATPDTLDAVLDDILTDRDRYREIAAQGVEFVHALHDGRVSAAVLEPLLRG